MAGVWDVNLPRFTTKLLCFWKGLSDRVAFCSPRRPGLRDAESNDAEVNYPKCSQFRLLPDEGCSHCTSLLR